MCTAITHAYVALAGGAACRGFVGPARFWVLAVAAAAGPDLDVLLHGFGVRYEDLWGHRGMTHSLLFALALSLLIVVWPLRAEARAFTRRWWGLLAFFFLLTASHGFMDAFTDGGLGIAFFSPFDPSRYFMPWTPLPVPNFGVRSLFTAYGAEVMANEIVWIWGPVTVAAVGVGVVRRALARRS